MDCNDGCLSLIRLNSDRFGTRFIIYDNLPSNSCNRIGYSVLLGENKIPKVTEEELINVIKKDPSKFSLVFNEYYKMIFGYVFRRTGAFEATRDILSEAFRKAFLNIRYFSYRGISIKVWLYRIATNETNLYFRQRKYSSRVTENYDPSGQDIFTEYLEEDRKSLELELLKNRQYNLVLGQIKKLPIRYQEVITLKYFEGKSNREICDILNRKEGTVKSLLSRGLKILKVKCNESGNIELLT